MVRVKPNNAKTIVLPDAIETAAIIESKREKLVRVNLLIVQSATSYFCKLITRQRVVVIPLFPTSAGSENFTPSHRFKTCQVLFDVFAPLCGSTRC